MKRRVQKILNFFVFNLLFFALYLNFIHKDQSQVLPVQPTVTEHPSVSVNSTVLVEHPEKYLEKAAGHEMTGPAISAAN